MSQQKTPIDIYVDARIDHPRITCAWAYQVFALDTVRKRASSVIQEDDQTLPIARMRATHRALSDTILRLEDKITMSSVIFTVHISDRKLVELVNAGTRSEDFSETINNIVRTCNELVKINGCTLWARYKSHYNEYNDLRKYLNRWCTRRGRKLENMSELNQHLKAELRQKS